MRHRSRSALALLVSVGALAASALVVAPASAATSPVITDCVAHGALSRTYSIAELHHALATLSATTREYTSCPDVINRALAAAVSVTAGSGTGSGGSGSFLPTPVLIILVLLVLAAVSFAAVAIRRRRADDG